jgi:hypothetical protein
MTRTRCADRIVYSPTNEGSMQLFERSGMRLVQERSASTTEAPAVCMTVATLSAVFAVAPTYRLSSAAASPFGWHQRMDPPDEPANP